jgi:hypothetical protein
MGMPVASRFLKEITLMTARSSEYAEQHPELAFAIFMDRVDRTIISLTGLSVFDFADAMWADLYEDVKHGGITDDLIKETLAEADDIFAAMIEAQDGE